MKALVLMAPGLEEMEAVITIDTLRRAGAYVVAAGLESGVLTASRDVKIEPDIPLDELTDAKEFDVLILPGGMGGTLALRDDVRVRDLLLSYSQADHKVVAAICAASLVLDRAGILEGKSFTCYPTVAKDIEGGTWIDEAVVVDGQLITSQGPGTAFAFALTIIETFLGAEARQQVAEGMLLA